ncbi:MAG: hypothetical protein R3F05_19430 [Planctomycetota bacterium]
MTVSTSLRRRARPWLGRAAWALAFTVGLLATQVAAEEDPPAPAPGPGSGSPTTEAPPAGGEENDGPPGSTAPHDVGGPRTPPRGSAREMMWPAPTADDWAKPVLIPFERTWDDAVAVSKETKKPILVCINMDGEIASEHYAGVRYRQPEIAALYEKYVCVIASVYRHNPKDFDEQGRRILCPRFGSVTCGEHIAIEPYLFERFCDGRRIAPRHIAVDLEGNEVYDAYYANDTASVFAAIRERVPNEDVEKPLIIRGDRPVIERVASRAAEDRNAVEAAFRAGDAETRKALLEAAKQNADAAQLGLVREGMASLDPEQARLAREALASMDNPAAVDALAEALKAPLEPAQREQLVAALDRLAASNTLARWLAVVHRGLDVKSDTVDAGAWADALGGATYPAPTIVLEDASLVAHAERKAKAVREHPEDPAVRIELAASLLQQALESPYVRTRTEREAERWAKSLYEEALATGHEAEALGAKGWRTDAVIALAAYHLDDKATAYERATNAMAELPPGDTTYLSMAIAQVFAEGRYKQIKAAVMAKERFPPVWIADLNAAYAILRAHPLGTDTQLAWHVDLLTWLGADRHVQAALQAGLERFPTSALLHERWRTIAKTRGGADGLEQLARDLMARPEQTEAMHWFAGLAEVEAAEQWRRGNWFSEAMKAYDRAIEHFEATAARWPETKDDVDDRVALALAAKARVALQADDDSAALEAILASFARRPDTAGTRDGMGITPGETAQMLRARLDTASRTEDVKRLDKALDTIDPELLRFDRP